LGIYGLGNPLQVLMEPGFSVNQRALPGAVPAIRAAVSRFLDAYDLPSSLIGDIRLALSEACANVVRHAYRGGAPGDVRCEVAVVDDEVVIGVSDWGCGFDAPSYRPGLGLGVEVMTMVADSVLVSRDDGKTLVTLRFRLPVSA
jgi:serine/threonine-protein kinase RsbW